MNKIKIIKKKKEIYVHTKLLPVQQLNQLEIELLVRGQICNLIPPYIVAGRKPEIMYRVSNLQSLRSYLSMTTSKKDFFKVVLSVLNMMKLGQDYMLNNANFILHMDYMFIEPRTKEILFIYLPIYNSGRDYEILNLLMALPYCTAFNSFEDCTYVSEYVAYFSNHQDFSIYEFELFIKNLSGITEHSENTEVNIAHPSKILNREVKVCPKCSQRYLEQGNFCEKCGVRLIFVEQFDAGNIIAPQMQAAPQVQQPIPQMQATPQMQQPMPQMQATPQMQQPMPQMQATPQMQQPMPQMQAAAQVCPILQMQSRPPVSAGTTVLGVVDCGTTVLSPQELGNVVYPHIVRKSNGERIDVNSDSFTVGQSTSADYSVSGNTAISRNHAVIITKDGKYYIVDNSSTNGTYIDGTRIPSGKEIEIVSGQKLRFANEEYEFIV